MKNKRIVKITAGILFVTLLAAMLLGGCTKPQPAGPKTLKIGGVAPLTGSGSPMGLAAKGGWELAFDKVNDEGGLKIGDETYMIELVAEDSKVTVDGAITAATKLINQDGVSFIMGDITDWMTVEITKIASEAGALHIITTLNLSAGTEGSYADIGPDNPLLIRLCTSMDELFPIALQHLAEVYPDVKTLSLTLMDFPEYDVCIPLTEAYAQEVGLTVVGTTQRIAMGTVDYYPQWTRLLEENPDAVFMPIMGIPDIGPQVKTARELGFTGPICYAIPVDINTAIEAAGPDTTDVFGTCISVYSDNVPDSVKEIKTRWDAKYDVPIISDAVAFYDTGYLLVQLLEKAQSLDPQIVAETFETLTEPGSLQSVFGPARVGGLKTAGANRIIVKPAPISAAIDGEPVLVKFVTRDIP